MTTPPPREEPDEPGRATPSGLARVPLPMWFRLARIVVFLLVGSLGGIVGGNLGAWIVETSAQRIESRSERAGWYLVSTFAIYLPVGALVAGAAGTLAAAAVTVGYRRALARASPRRHTVGT